MKKPIIGITCSLSEREYILNRAYVKAVSLCGGLPVIMPASDDEGVLTEYVNLADGILFAGGTDILPGYFGEFLYDGYEMPYELSPERDRFEISLFKCADKRELPMLGICRGIQLMAVAGGGSIYQDIDSMMARQIRIRHKKHAPADSVSHPVIVSEHTVLGRILKRKTTWVNSMHHQSVRIVPAGYRVCATAPDGVIEGIEAVDEKRFAIGVQWHPERLLSSIEGDANMQLFREFVRAAQHYGNEVKKYGNTTEG